MDAQLLLQNNGIIYGDATVSLLNACSTKTLPAKWKYKGVFTLHELNLTGLPDHSLAFSLSTDTTLDAGDFLMQSVPLIKGHKLAFKKGTNTTVNPNRQDKKSAIIVTGLLFTK